MSKKLISLVLLLMMMACVTACGKESADKQLAQFCEYEMPSDYQAVDMLEKHDDKNQPVNLIFSKNEINAFSAVVITNTEENTKTIDKLIKSAKKVETQNDKTKLTLKGNSKDKTAYVWENREVYLIVSSIILDDEIMEKEYQTFVDNIKVPDSYPQKQ